MSLLGRVRRANEVFASPRGTVENDLRQSRQSVRQGAGAGETDELGFLFDRGKDWFQRATTRNMEAPDRELLINISRVYGTGPNLSC